MTFRNNPSPQIFSEFYSKAKRCSFVNNFQEFLLLMLFTLKQLQHIRISHREANNKEGGKVLKDLEICAGS